jgi:hypothetical protein
MLPQRRMVATSLATQALCPDSTRRCWLEFVPCVSSRDGPGRVQLEGLGPTRNLMGADGHCFIGRRSSAATCCANWGSWPVPAYTSGGRSALMRPPMAPANPTVATDLNNLGGAWLAVVGPLPGCGGPAGWRQRQGGQQLHASAIGWPSQVPVPISPTGASYPVPVSGWAAGSSSLGGVGWRSFG